MIYRNEVTMISVFDDIVIVSTKEGLERKYAIPDLNKIHIKVTKRPVGTVLFFLTPFPFLLLLPADMELFILTTILLVIGVSLISYQRIKNRIKFKLVIQEQNNSPLEINLPVGLKYTIIDTISLIRNSHLYKKVPNYSM